MTTNERKQYSREYTELNRRFEKKWFPKVKKAIDSKTSSLTRVIKEDGLEAGIRYLNTDLANFQLQQVIKDLYSEVGSQHARRAERRLRKEVGKSFSDMETKGFGRSAIWVKWIQDFLTRFLIEKITFAVNRTTREALLSVVNDAIANGWGIDETVKRLEELPFARYQAARIVRTEINRAANTGVQAQGESFEYQLNKEWIAVKDNRTRGVNPEDHADHYHMDEQTVDFEGKFIDKRSKEQLRFPGDPEAKPGDTINCRCNMATMPKRNEAGRLIKK